MKAQLYKRILLMCKHLTQNSDRCWKVCFLFFNSGTLNINSAEKVEYELRNHQLWDGSQLFSFIICLTVFSFLLPVVCLAGLILPLCQM